MWGLVRAHLCRLSLNVHVDQYVRCSSAIQSVFVQSKNITTTTVRQCSNAKDGDSDAPIELKNPFEREKKICILCKFKIHPDYKNVKLLSQFQSPYTGRIYGRHITGLCKKKQDKVELEIKKSQKAGLMPYYFKELCFVNDPKLFNPERPIRPHPY